MATNGQTQPTPAAATGTVPPPLLYTRPVMMSPASHGALKLVRPRTYDFARRVTGLPVNAVEFRRACVDYPIVFTAAGVPVAMVGIRQDENLMIDADGHWERAAYVPAYVRRYPFIAAAKPGEESSAKLAIDHVEGLLSPDGDEALFEDGKPTAFLGEAAKFCAAFQEAANETSAFTAAIKDAGLLVERRLDLTIPGQRQFAVNGFQLIDEEKLKALDGITVTDWNHRGWLALIHFHLASLGTWSDLAERLARRMDAAAQS